MKGREGKFLRTISKRNPHLHCLDQGQRAMTLLPQDRGTSQSKDSRSLPGLPAVLDRTMRPIPNSPEAKDGGGT